MDGEKSRFVGFSRLLGFLLDLKVLFIIFFSLTALFYYTLTRTARAPHKSDNDDLYKDYQLFSRNQGEACEWRFCNGQDDPLHSPMIRTGDGQAWEHFQQAILKLDRGPLLYLNLDDFSSPSTILQSNLTRKQKTMAAANLKYFDENGPWGHFDKRFYKEPFARTYSQLPQVKQVQQALFQAWHNFTMTYSIPYWINHGSLLGWSWNKKSFPWDMDIDVQTTMRGLAQLQVHNQTRWRNRYLIDVNYHWWVREEQNRNNIDARFIDTKNGAFIDVTGLWQSDIRVGSSDQRLLICKDKHQYQLAQISPLHLTEFMGSEAWRPHEPTTLLSQEYGWLSFARSIFYNFNFNETSQEWEQNHNFPLSRNHSSP